MDDSNAWLLDEEGRRYRMIGKIKEYERLVLCNGIEIPESELADYHINTQAKETEIFKKPQSKNVCPYRRNSTDPTCTGDKCAWWNDDCVIKSGNATKDGICPVAGNFVHRCSALCVAYNNGCQLAKTFTVIVQKEEKTNEQI